LRLKRNLMRLFIETTPQERGQPQQHPVSIVALWYEPRDGVERIEEEMRPELRSQCIEFRAVELRLQGRVAIAKAQRQVERRNEPVEEHSGNRAPGQRRRTADGFQRLVRSHRPRQIQYESSDAEREHRFYHSHGD